MTQTEKPAPAGIAGLQKKALIRVVDDDISVRDALQCVLEIEGWKVATFESAESYLKSDSPSVPGVVVMDIRMPGRSGLEAQVEMRERDWHTPIVFLTGHGEVDMAVMALKRGAVDFLQKPVDNERFLEAVAQAAALSMRAVPGDTDERPAERAAGRWETLTDKERTVARLIAGGLTNRQTAERLGNAIRTVEVHRANIYRKLEVKTPEELAELVRALPER